MVGPVCVVNQKAGPDNLDQPDDFPHIPRPDRAAAFRWKIRAEKPGAYRGVVRLYLEIPSNEGGEVEQEILLARPIQIEAVSVIGLPGAAARGLGAVGLLASAALGYSWALPQMKRLWRLRGGQKT